MLTLPSGGDDVRGVSCPEERAGEAYELTVCGEYSVSSKVHWTLKDDIGTPVSRQFAAMLLDRQY